MHAIGKFLRLGFHPPPKVYRPRNNMRQGAWRYVGTVFGIPTAVKVDRHGVLWMRTINTRGIVEGARLT